MNEDQASRLLGLLGGMAMYNDKGFEWSNHSPAQVENERVAFDRMLAAFIADVGPENIPGRVLAVLRLPDLRSDASGRHVDSVRDLLQ
jgi:hypothetical protein